MTSAAWHSLRSCARGVTGNTRYRDLAIIAAVAVADVALLTYGGGVNDIGAREWSVAAGARGGLAGMALGFGVLLVTTLLLARRMDNGSTVREETPPLDEMVRDFHQTLGALQASHTQLSRLRHQAEKTVEDLESYNRQVLSSISSGVVNLTGNGVVTMINPAARCILRLPSGSAAIGRSATELWGPEAPLTQLLTETQKQPRNRSRVELRLDAADGSEVWVGLSVSVLRARDGGLGGITLLMSDLTEVRRLRRELGLRQRLAAMGELTACIAHNFRNSLAAILGYATIMEKRVGDDEDHRRPLRAITREVREMEQGIRNLLEGLGPKESSLSLLDLGELVRDVVEGLRLELKERNIELSTELPHSLPPVMGDAGALSQLAANLIHNAIEAMPGGGSLSVRLTAADACAGESPNPPSGTCGTYSTTTNLVLTITDTGVGIPPELKAKVFEAFFTTREKGTGLGLALARATAERHGGRIEVESRPDEGTTFSIILPAEVESIDGR